MDVISLHINQLHCGYGKLFVPPYSIQSDILKPTLIALVGKNGTGKSTLLRTIAGIQKPLEGNISIGTINYLQLSVKERAQWMAYLPAYNSKIPYLSVEEYVSLGKAKQKHDVSKDKLREILQSLEIEHKAHHYLTQLSDGEMQRVAIARVFFQDCPILLFDEPTAHLDPKQQLNVLHLFFQMVKEKEKIILFSSHLTETVLAFAHKIWLLGENDFVDKIPEQIIIDKDLEKNELKLSHSGALPIKNQSSISVRIIGDGLAYQYTKFALLRYGINTSCNKSPCCSVIIQQNQKGNFSWLIKKEQMIVKELTTLENVIEYILNNL